MQGPTMDKVRLTPIDVERDHVTHAGAEELTELRDSISSAVRTINCVMMRTRTGEGNSNPNYSSETGRAAAVALTKLEEALMWAERAYLWEGK